MITQKWKIERIGTGKYRVRSCAVGDAWDNSQVLPGMIIGGNGRWFIQRGGKQLPDCYPTASKASERIVSDHFIG